MCSDGYVCGGPLNRTSLYSISSADAPASNGSTNTTTNATGLGGGFRVNRLYCPGVVSSPTCIWPDNNNRIGCLVFVGLSICGCLLYRRYVSKAKNSTLPRLPRAKKPSRQSSIAIMHPFSRSDPGPGHADLRTVECAVTGSRPDECGAEYGDVCTISRVFDDGWVLDFVNVCFQFLSHHGMTAEKMQNSCIYQQTVCVYSLNV